MPKPDLELERIYGISMGNNPQLSNNSTIKTQSELAEQIGIG